METQKVFKKVVSEMKNLKCPEHKEKAVIKLSGTSKEPNISADNVCCEKFEKKIKSVATEKLQKYFRSEISSDIDRIFKRFKS